MSKGACIRGWSHSLCLLAVVGAALVVAACGGAGSDATPRAGASGAPALNGNVTVFAASSLTDAFKAIGSAFEKENPGTKVSFNFGASSALAVQINEGAPADVFASADTEQMAVVAKTGASGPSVIFASNRPVVVVPKGDNRVQSFAGLAKPGVKLVLAAPEVPIGEYARQILANASGDDGLGAGFSKAVLGNLQSNEANVRAVLAKVEIGEADAGIVYTTDAATATKDVKTVPIPNRYNVVAAYPMAVLKRSGDIDVAQAFVKYVNSNPGRQIMQRYGFGSGANIDAGHS